MDHFWTPCSLQRLWRFLSRTFPHSLFYLTEYRIPLFVYHKLWLLMSSVSCLGCHYHPKSPGQMAQRNNASLQSLWWWWAYLKGTWHTYSFICKLLCNVFILRVLSLLADTSLATVTCDHRRFQKELMHEHCLLNNHFYFNISVIMPCNTWNAYDLNDSI